MFHRKSYICSDRTVETLEFPYRAIYARFGSPHMRIDIRNLIFVLIENQKLPHRTVSSTRISEKGDTKQYGRYLDFHITSDRFKIIRKFL